MNNKFDSIIRHVLTTVISIVGLLPATKVFLPVLVSISENMDNIFLHGGSLLASATAIWAAWKYKRK